MLVSDFDFDLPEELVAQQAAPRGKSRLLVLDRAAGALHHDTFLALGRYLRKGDLLVVNDTRVFAARLLGRRVPSGGAVECLLLGAGTDDPGGGRVYDALVHPGQKLKPGSRVRFGEGHEAIDGEILSRHFNGRRRVRLQAAGDLDALIDALGHVPLPPYITRQDDPEDRERYQTVFARARGSVAAPTAGLHFSPEVLADLDARGVERAAVTLHVGYGTFKPVRVEVVEEHAVDPERYEISAAAAEAIERARREQRRVIAVGTTTTRTLEHAARLHGGTILPHAGEASLFIYPGHQFQVVSGLITNFHVPRSSLLMLVAAFAGRERILEAYRVAVQERYRFYSYGDAMLIL